MCVVDSATDNVTGSGVDNISIFATTGLTALTVDDQYQDDGLVQPQLGGDAADPVAHFSPGEFRLL